MVSGHSENTARRPVRGMLPGALTLAFVMWIVFITVLIAGGAGAG